jgi:hypothetical protein
MWACVHDNVAVLLRAVQTALVHHYAQRLLPQIFMFGRHSPAARVAICDAGVLSTILAVGLAVEPLPALSLSLATGTWGAASRPVSFQLRLQQLLNGAPDGGSPSISDAVVGACVHAFSCVDAMEREQAAAGASVPVHPLAGKMDKPKVLCHFVPGKRPHGVRQVRLTKERPVVVQFTGINAVPFPDTLDLRFYSDAQGSTCVRQVLSNSVHEFAFSGSELFVQALRYVVGSTARCRSHTVSPCRATSYAEPCAGPSLPLLRAPNAVTLPVCRTRVAVWGRCMWGQA